MRTQKVLGMAGLVVGLVVVMSVGITLAQVTAGRILGTVHDSTGGVLPGATVTIMNEETGLSRMVVTDEAGRYAAPGLSVGNYRVTGSQAGFQTVVRSGIVLTVGRDAVVDLALEVGAVTQTVEVTGEAPLVESTTAGLGSLVDDRTIRALPLNGRSYDQLALLQPGVTLFDTGASGTNFGSGGTGQRFSVGGQRPTANRFLLDGTNINDQANNTPGGAAGTNLGVEAIREFKVFTNSFKAEYGHSSGGIISAVTRSGTNMLHGTAFGYLRNSALDARNFFDVGSEPPPFRRSQFGGVLGGPIKKDKTFFFGGYEGLRQGLGTSLAALVPTLRVRQGILPTGTVQVNSIIAPYLALYPVPNGRDFGDGTAEFLSAPTFVINQDNFMGRVDHQFNDNTSLFGRYMFDEDNVVSPSALGPPFADTADGRRQYTTVQLNSILGPKALNNFRFAYNRTYYLTEQRGIPPGPLSFISGQPLGGIGIGAGTLGSGILTTLGTADAESIWKFSVFQWADDFTYVTGKHSFKTGTDIQRIWDNNGRAISAKGHYTFRTLAALVAGTPAVARFAAPRGSTGSWRARQSMFAVYGQDDFTVNSRLTLNLGLRWEAVTDPYDVDGRHAILYNPLDRATVPSDRFFSVGKRNIEPRFGLAWQVTGSGRTVVRAGGGIYHNQILSWVSPNARRNPPFFGTIEPTNPPFPDASALIPVTLSAQGDGIVALKTMAPFNKTPTTYHYTLSIQQEVARDTVFQIAYAGNRSVHQPTSIETNTPYATILPDGRKLRTAGALRRNPAWAGILVTTTEGTGRYNGVILSLRRQSSSGFEGQVSYTLSKAMANGGGFASNESARSRQSTLDPEDIGRDYSLDDIHSTHVASFNFSYALPFRINSRALGAVVNGWTLDGVGTLRSGQPFTALLASAVSRDLSSNSAERPDLRPGASQNPTNKASVGCPGFPAGTKLRGADNFYDPCSFVVPEAGTYGNVGRNTLIGPGLANLDLALGKRFLVKEKADVTFKAELFNVFNHTNLGLPNNRPLGSNGAASPSAGRVTYTTTKSRQLQFGLRIGF